MEQWIQTRLASDLGISCGIRTTFLEKGAAEIQSRLFDAMPGHSLPSSVELFLQIEAEISDALLSVDPIWQPLINYVQGKEKRQIALASYLTKLLERYGTSALEAALDWERRPTHWQEALWGKVFSKWDYPQRAFADLLPKEFPSSNFGVHLFGFSHISPLHLHFFRQAARHVPIYLYQLSPCQEFWSDIGPDHPSLLAPLGKMGREMARFIEENDLPTDENYLSFGGDTQLKRVQRGILTLQQEEEVTEDDSIQIHALATPHQEIDHLHQLCQEWLREGNLEPKDILVMAPQISTYAPYIQAIFGRTIDFQIADMPLQQGSPPLEALFFLLDLEKKRWSAPALLELFDFVIFHKKIGLTAEDLAQMRLWVCQTGIRWGVDGQHKASLLEQEHPIEEAATWMEGLRHLIEELALPYTPTRIRFTQAESLGKIASCIASLYRDTRELHQKKSLSAWTAYLKGLFEKYFIVDDGSAPVYSLLENLARAARNFEQKLYSFPLIDQLLKECVGRESVTLNRHQLQAVRFCSLLPMRTIPAKVIYLLGMNHDAFPRKDQLKGLDHLGKHPRCGYSPSRLDFDRSLFLEALLSAREKFVISYLGRDPYDLSPLPPSSVVAHLLPFISQTQWMHHPGQLLKKAAITEPAPLDIELKKFTLPSGEEEIAISDWVRFAGSFLSHYLYHQGLKFPREVEILDEESFVLSPKRKAALRQEALHAPLDTVLKKIKKEGDFPTGIFGALAHLQVAKEVEGLLEIDLREIHLDPFLFEMNPNLSVFFTGSLEQVFDRGLCVQGKKDFRTAVKAWPLLVLLNAYDQNKNELLFASSSESVSLFCESAEAELKKLLHLYFYSRAHPVLLPLEWVEGIVKRDPKKIKPDSYDEIFNWYVRGKGKIESKRWIDHYSPLIEPVYGGIADGWF